MKHGRLHAEADYYRDEARFWRSLARVCLKDDHRAYCLRVTAEHEARAAALDLEAARYETGWRMWWP